MNNGINYLSTGAGFQPSTVLREIPKFPCEVVVNQMDETLSLRIEATNGAHPAPVTLLNRLKWTYDMYIYTHMHM